MDDVGNGQVDGREASFEAIRASLPPNNGKDLVKKCTTGAECALNWRHQATKVLILATDEDSDCKFHDTDSKAELIGPVMEQYQMPNLEFPSKSFICTAKFLVFFDI